MTTWKELKKSRNDWRFTAIFFICFFIFICILILVFSPASKIEKLQEELQICQEQVPTCDIEHGYWGFRVVCDDDFFGWKNRGKVIDQHFHKDLESCERGLNLFVSDENCEVISDDTCFFRVVVNEDIQIVNCSLVDFSNHPDNCLRTENCEVIE